jgi:hypothetical protein
MFLVPFCENAFESIKTNRLAFLGVLNLVISFILGYLKSSHDFCYSFIIEDHLSKRESESVIFILIQDIILASVSNYDMVIKKKKFN